MVKLQAKNGVSTEYPKSSLTAFRAAVEQKYDSVWLEVELTPDGQLAVRGEDPVKTRRAKFAGMTAAKVREVLELAWEHCLYVRIGSAWEVLPAFGKEPLLQMLESFAPLVMLTCNSVASVKAIAERFPQMQLQYDGQVTQETLEQLSAIVPKEKLTVWLSMEEARHQALSVKTYARLGIETLESYDQLEQAEALGAETVSTPGQLKPVQNEGLLSDMHTHSQNSMDANVPILDLCRGELEAGVKMVAIADHCEMSWLDTEPERDIYSCFMDCWKEIHEVQQELGESIAIHMGMELGQGAWYPEHSKKLIAMLPYDVIVGAVHSIKDPTVDDWIKASTKWQQFYDEPYLQKLPLLWNRYFDEVLTMVETVDIDVVAHMTFIARGAFARHGWMWDLHPYEEKIKKILQTIIDRGIALEVNVGGSLKNGIDPQEWILELYHQMGGYLITMASDAHGASDPVRAGFRQNAEKLKKMGFRNIFYYKGRRSYPCAL